MRKKAKPVQPIRVLMFREAIHDGKGNIIRYMWVAVGIDYYLASQGETKRECVHSFSHVLIGQCLLDLMYSEKPHQRGSPAPRKYLLAWNKAARNGVRKRNAFGAIHSKHYMLTPTITYPMLIATLRKT